MQKFLMERKEGIRKFQQSKTSIRLRRDPKKYSNSILTKKTSWCLASFQCFFQAWLVHSKGFHFSVQVLQVSYYTMGEKKNTWENAKSKILWWGKTNECDKSIKFYYLKFSPAFSDCRRYARMLFQYKKNKIRWIHSAVKSSWFYAMTIWGKTPFFTSNQSMQIREKCRRMMLRLTSKKRAASSRISLRNLRLNYERKKKTVSKKILLGMENSLGCIAPGEALAQQIHSTERE